MNWNDMIKDMLDKFVAASADIGKFIAFWFLLFMGYQHYEADIDFTLAFVEDEIATAYRQGSRYLNHNVVTWLRRPYFWCMMLATLFGVIALIPLVLLSEVQIGLVFLFFSGLNLGFWWTRYHALTRVQPIPSPVIANSRLNDTRFTALNLGPSDAFQIRDLFGFPAVLVAQGVINVLAGVCWHSLLNVSAVFGWILAVSGGLSIWLGGLMLVMVLDGMRYLIDKPGKWTENGLRKMVGFVAEPALLFITPENVNSFIPEGFIEAMLKAIDGFVAMLKKVALPSLILISIAGVSLSITILGIVLVAGVFIGLLFNKSKDLSEDEAFRKSSFTDRLNSHKFMGGVLVLIFLYKLGVTSMYRLHAIPTVEYTVGPDGVHPEPVISGPVEMFAAMGAWFADQWLLGFIVTGFMVILGKKVWDSKTKGEEMFTVSRVIGIALIIFGTGLSMVSWGGLSGRNLVPQRSYLYRYHTTPDEAWHCLNGRHDYDEVFTDHGPSCSPYRQVRIATDVDGNVIRRNNRTYFEPSPGSRYANPEFIETHATLSLGQRVSNWFSDLGTSIKRFFLGTTARAQPRPYIVAPTSFAVQNQSQGVSTKAVTVAMVSAPRSMPQNELVELIRRKSEQYDVSFELIAAVMYHESTFNPRAVSRMGCQGLMQLMPDTARGLGVTNSFDPEQNVDGGVRYLRQQLIRYNGDLRRALAAYNAGPGNIQAGYQYAEDVQRLYQRYLNGNGPIIAYNNSTPRAHPRSITHDALDQAPQYAPAPSHIDYTPSELSQRCDRLPEDVRRAIPDCN